MSDDSRQLIKNRLFSESNDASVFFHTYNEYLHSLSSGGVTWNHLHVIHAIDLLKQNPRVTRQEAEKAIGNHKSTRAGNFADPPLRLAVECITMVDCSQSSCHAPTYLIGDYKPVDWELDETFAAFVARALPNVTEKPLPFDNRIIHSLMASRLKELRVKIVPTDNLANHLLYDKRTSQLLVFHHAGFLKARIQKELEQEGGPSSCPPPQLFLETLHSIQFIIFPVWSMKSREILEKLVSGGNERMLFRKSPPHDKFDPECLKRDTDLGLEFQYHYWGDRISTLIKDLEERERFLNAGGTTLFQFGPFSFRYSGRTRPESQSAQHGTQAAVDETDPYSEGGGSSVDSKRPEQASAPCEGRE